MSGLLFVLVAGTLAHLLLSRHGFSPTDDGFILAGARRLADGQVPHRDFVSVRPVLSLALHLPELLLGRDWCLLLSRWVFWCEMAAISWLWTGLLDVQNRLPLAVVAFALSSQLFPAMAWHTVDALLLATAGIALLPSSVGFLLLGAAVLCRQNFALMIPIVAAATREPAALLMLAPAAAYAAAIAASGGWRDLVAQLGSYGAERAFGVGLWGYLNRWSILGLVLGGALVVAGVGPWRLALAPLVAAPLLAAGRVDVAAFTTFAAAVLVVAREPGVASLLLVALAWCSSLSIGYPWPALLLGPLTLAASRIAATEPWAWAAAAVTATLVVLARRRFPYRDLPVRHLRWPLGEVLRGGRGIRVSETVHRMLADLERSIRLATTAGERYAVVPDLAAHWMRSEQRNPLSSDWPQDTELGSDSLRSRLVRDFASVDRLVVLLQKFWLRDPSGRPRRATEDPVIVRMIRTSGEKASESEYFEEWRTLAASQPEGAGRIEAEQNQNVTGAV